MCSSPSAAPARRRTAPSACRSRTRQRTRRLIICSRPSPPASPACEGEKLPSSGQVWRLKRRAPPESRTHRLRLPSPVIHTPTRKYPQRLSSLRVFSSVSHLDPRAGFPLKAVSGLVQAGDERDAAALALGKRDGGLNLRQHRAGGKLPLSDIGACLVR